MTLLQSHKKFDLEAQGYTLATLPKNKSYKIGCCHEKVMEGWLILIQPLTNHWVVITLNGTVKDIEINLP